MPSQTEIRQTITNRIVDALEKGDLPPWRQTLVLPHIYLIVSTSSAPRTRR
jgi:antirestriction protein ArdC